MAQPNQSPGGDFLQILGIIYLIKMIRRRRRRHRMERAAVAGTTGRGPVTGPQPNGRTDRPAD
jgi:hypothetical protein